MVSSFIWIVLYVPWFLVMCARDFCIYFNFNFISFSRLYEYFHLLEILVGKIRNLFWCLKNCTSFSYSANAHGCKIRHIRSTNCNVLLSIINMVAVYGTFSRWPSVFWKLSSSLRNDEVIEWLRQAGLNVLWSCSALASHWMAYIELESAIAVWAPVFALMSSGRVAPLLPIGWHTSSLKVLLLCGHQSLHLWTWKCYCCVGTSLCTYGRWTHFHHFSRANFKIYSNFCNKHMLLGVKLGLLCFNNKLGNGVCFPAKTSLIRTLAWPCWKIYFIPLE